jgi:hypothetical protein
MNVNSKKIHVKATSNGGFDLSYDTIVMEITDISIPVCGCGSHPEIVQSPDGRPMYDYSGENFQIKCECGITLKTEETIPAISGGISKFNRLALNCIEKLVAKWSNVFRDNRRVKINFTTRK